MATFLLLVLFSEPSYHLNEESSLFSCKNRFMLLTTCLGEEFRALIFYVYISILTQSEYLSGSGENIILEYEERLRSSFLDIEY